MSLPVALGFAAALSAGAQAANSPSCPVAIAPAAAAASVAPSSRIARDWRSGAWSVLPATKPPMLRDAVDLGPAPGGTVLPRMLLLLEPSPAQLKALDTLLAQQQISGSCEYHHWLTPEQFAERFANSSADINAVTGWLQAQGFAVAPLPASRGWIEFSGTAEQVREAFQSPVHQFSATGGNRYALAAPISVPAALAPVIHGLASLDGSVAAAGATQPEPLAVSPEALAGETDLSRAEALTPQLAAKVLQLEGMPKGEGESIAIAARSNIQSGDVAAFRSTFGLSANAVITTPAGADPGLTADQAAIELAASWAGVAAPAARILLVPASRTAATDGVDLSLAAIVDRDQAHSIVVPYSSCEAALSEAHQAFYADLFRQAAAQGMSVVVASGDSGAAACHAAGSLVPVRTGYAVNALAATPWNTAVGAAAMGSQGASDVTAWSPVTAADAAFATGGGRSSSFAKPSWQPALVATDTTRLLPDVSLPTALDTAFSHGLAFCFSSSAQSTGCNLVRGGGSAVAAAIFGGVSAAIAQQYGAQGNLAPHLYKLAGSPGVFSDVAQGSTRLACASGTAGCGASGTVGFDAAPGYDLATGLGVPNAAQMVSVWATPDVGSTNSTVNLTVSPTQANATYNPQASITFNVAVSGGSGTPTGTINFFDQATGANLNTSPYALDSTGATSITLIGGMPQGGNSVIARYSGDSTYAAQNSQAVTVNIQPSTTTPTVTPSTTTPAAGTAFPVTVAIAVGSPAAGTAAPTGQVTLTLDGATYATASLATASNITSASFSVTIASGGSHNLQAIYAGDSNYATSTSASVAVTVSKGTTVTTLTASPTTLTAGTPETLTATIASANSVPGATNTFTGSVTFYDGTSQIGTATVSGNSASLPNVTLSGTSTHSLTAVYSGDSTWTGSTSNIVTLKAVLIPVTLTLTVTPTNAAPGQVVSMLATVTPTTAPATNIEKNPTGSVIFYNGTKILATVPLTAGANNTSTAELNFATLPAGQDTISAAYLGDLYYDAATSNAVTITVEDFTITPGPNNPPSDLDIVKGTSGQVSFVFTGLGGFNGQIAVTCAVPAGDDMTCTPNPVTLTPTGTVTFTVTTYLTGGPTSARRNPPPLWPRAASGTAFAALLFFLLPFGRRARMFSVNGKRVLMLALLFGGAMAGMGCTSSSANSVLNSQGTPLGQTTLTITAAANVDNTVFSHTTYLSVNVLSPGATGTAQPAPGGQLIH